MRCRAGGVASDVLDYQQPQRARRGFGGVLLLASLIPLTAALYVSAAAEEPFFGPVRVWDVVRFALLPVAMVVVVAGVLAVEARRGRVAVLVFVAAVGAAVAGLNAVTVWAYLADLARGVA